MNIRITIYNKETGEIRGVSDCLEESAADQCMGAEGFVVGNYEPTKYYIDPQHAVVKIKPPQPTKHHIFDHSTKQWMDPRTIKTEWPLVRAKRELLLSKSDWTQLPDVPVKTKEAWATYRQALRDITEQPDPFNIVWPTPPVT